MERERHITREVIKITSVFEGELNDAKKMVCETRDMQLKKTINNLTVQLVGQGNQVFAFFENDLLFK